MWDKLLPARRYPANATGVARDAALAPTFGPCLVSKKFYKIFQIFHHNKSLDACMKY